MAALPSPAEPQAVEQQSSTAKRGSSFFDGLKARGKGASPVGQEKELSKLRRVDLLELLVDATRENERLSDALAYETDLAERLKVKLDEKDAQIEHLKARLDSKDARMSELEGQNAAMAHAIYTVTADEILEIERLAVGEYLKQVAARCTQNGEDPQGGALISMVPPSDPRGKHTTGESPVRKLFSGIRHQR